MPISCWLCILGSIGGSLGLTTGSAHWSSRATMGMWHDGHWLAWLVVSCSHTHYTPLGESNTTDTLTSFSYTHNPASQTQPTPVWVAVSTTPQKKNLRRVQLLVSTRKYATRLCPCRIRLRQTMPSLWDLPPPLSLCTNSQLITHGF